MNTPHQLILPVCLLLFSSDLHAQVLVSRGPYGVGGFVAGGGFSYSRGNRFRLDVGFLGGGLYGPGQLFGPLGCPPFGYRRGYHYSVTNVITPPPTIVVQQPIVPPPIVINRFDREEGDFLSWDPTLLNRKKPVPDIPAVPDEREMVPPRPVPPKVDPPKKEPAKPPRNFDPNDVFPPPPPAAADPRSEHDTQVKEGLEAFRLQEYGRAVQRFRKAVSLRKAARSYFYLAQSLLALGKYHEASDAILDGLRQDGSWPTSDFRPLEMYDEVNEYGEHLRQLNETNRRHHGDRVLLFLRGYTLWFDGRQDEAAKVFSEALERIKAEDAERITRAVQTFLAALPAGEGL